MQHNEDPSAAVRRIALLRQARNAGMYGQPNVPSGGVSQPLGAPFSGSTFQSSGAPISSGGTHSTFQHSGSPLFGGNPLGGGNAMLQAPPAGGYPMYTGSSLQVQTYPGSSWNQGQGGQPAWGKVALVKKEPGILAAPQTEVRELICDELDVATVGETQCVHDALVETGKAAAVILMKQSADIKEIQEHLGIQKKPSVLTLKSIDDLVPTSKLLKQKPIEEYEAKSEKSKLAFETHFAKLKRSFSDEMAHRFAKNLADDIYAEEVKALPAPPAGGAAKAGPTVFNETIYDEIVQYKNDFDPTSADMLDWARQKRKLTKDKKMSVPAQENLLKNMATFGLVYFLEHNGGNPFIDVSKAVEKEFVQFKLAHGFPADMDWDGTKP